MRVDARSPPLQSPAHGQGLSGLPALCLAYGTVRLSRHASVSQIHILQRQRCAVIR